MSGMGSIGSAAAVGLVAFDIDDPADDDADDGAVVLTCAITKVKLWVLLVQQACWSQTDKTCSMRSRVLHVRTY